jgi:hypothetical protein
MRPRILAVSLGLLCLAGFVVRLHANYPRNQGPTVQVSVQAADTSGGVIHYRWKSTDGNLISADSPTVNWTLPAGPGLHFAYVLASNGLGGYTEKRIAVNTDTIGTKAGEDDSRALPYLAPPAAAPQGDTYRSSVGWGFANAHDMHPPDVSVYVQDTATGITYPPTGPETTDLRGDFIIPNLPPANSYVTYCQPPGTGAPTVCTAGFFFGGFPMPSVATTDYLSSFPGLDSSTTGSIDGNFTLQDGNPCGTLNEFFGVHVTGTATLLDANGTPVGTPGRMNELGDFAVQYPIAASPVSVSLQCEGNPPFVTAIAPSALSLGDLGTIALPGVSAPEVQSMTATLNGSAIASVNFQSPTPLPSDIVSRADAFLAEKGLDTRGGACQYYKAIGAVQGCAAAGGLIAPITFNDWKRTVKIDGYSKGGVPTFRASYINKVDLNLARVHQSISYGPNQTAAVVCNHLGPPDFFNSPQAEVDTAVDNANHNKNLVACVAMDYMVSPGVNNNQPFVRFLIFGPSGQLLPSINLDGRREKFVPGTCVVCHGGDHYAGKFPEDGSGSANVGGHFLPYDTGNFEFSSKFGLREKDQEQAIYFLNQNLLNAGPTPAEQALIAGWYANQPGFKKVLNKTYIDPSWPAQGTAAYNFYQDVYARSCRTCHVALVEGYNFDHYQNITPGNGFYRADSPEVDVSIATCGGDSQIFRDHSMANSLVTFNRFWLTADSTANTSGLPNQPDELNQFLTTPNFSNPCILGKTP